MKIETSRGDRCFDVICYIVMGMLLVIMVYPLYFVLIASISDPYSVVNGKVVLLPKGVTLEPYINVLREARVWIGYRNTLIYTIAGTALNLILTIPAGYVMSKKALMGRKFWSAYFLVPMYFNGGLLPTYLTIKSLGLVNQSYTLIMLGGLSIYNMIVTRVFFETTIPEEVYESAQIDGASEFRVFLQIAVPLSGAIIAVISLYYAVARWNEYFNALVYVSKSEYSPLQMVLRNILLQSQTALANITMDSMIGEEEIKDLARQSYMAEAMKYALIIIASAPLLIVYPFVQRFFVKGVMIGAVKG